MVAKVPVLRVSFQQKNERTPECHWRIRPEGEVWETMCRGLEERLKMILSAFFHLDSSIAWKLGGLLYLKVLWEEIPNSS